jgi:pyruvate formate lyase activating enzyme
MTLSGGEPLNQPEFTKALLTLAHEENLHCTVDSSGFAPWEVAGPVFELADLVLYDLKTVDDDHHQELTGVSNKPILANLEKMLESDDGPSVWLRMPLIPGCNDSDETVSAMAELCSELSQHPRLERVYLMPYHKLAEGKYIQFGVEYGLAGLDSPSDENIKRVAAIFSDRGVTVRHD